MNNNAYVGQLFSIVFSKNYFVDEKEFEDYCKKADLWWKTNHDFESKKEFELRIKLARPRIINIKHEL